MSQKEQPDRFLEWEACHNAREVGGYPVEGGKQTRWRTLIRTDNLHRLTPTGQSMLCDYGVRTVIDLRLPEEIESEPNPFSVLQSEPDRPRYLHLPLHDPAATEAIDKAESMAEGYIVILETSKPLIAAVIEAVAGGLQEGGVVVHCHGGKDRTGIVVALLLSVAGVPRENIVEDYTLSETQLEPSYVAWLEEQSRTEGRPVERPKWMYSRPETMGGALSYLDREYGGVVEYLESAGVSASIIEQIRDRLIEPDSGASS